MIIWELFEETKPDLIIQNAIKTYTAFFKSITGVVIDYIIEVFNLALKIEPLLNFFMFSHAVLKVFDITPKFGIDLILNDFFESIEVDLFGG